MTDLNEIEGGALIIDKEKGWTSFDVVNKLRHVLKVKKVGHTGTLDPNATGVLVIMFGKATKLSEKIMHDTKKTYEAEMIFGIRTDTQDITGDVLSEVSCNVSKERLKEVLSDFTGGLLQTPPMYSAKKKDGKKLYEYARAGVEVERKPSKIHIYSNELCAFGNSRALIRVSCSSGTYIRTLINDMGDVLSCGACMGDLRRLAVGKFSIEDAIKVSEVRRLIEEDAIEPHIISLEELEK